MKELTDERGGLLMSSRRGIRGEARARLMRAGAECFARTGRRAMTVDEIRAEAGAGVGTVYHHFPMGLEDIEGALYLDTLANYQRGLLDELKRQDSASEGVRRAVDFHLRWMAENLTLAHFLLHFSPSWLTTEHLETVEAMNAAFAAEAAEWTERHVRSGEMRSMPPELYGPIVLGPAQQYGSQVIAKRDSGDVAGAINRARPALAAAAWSAVKGDAGS